MGIVTTEASSVEHTTDAVYYELRGQTKKLEKSEAGQQ